MIKSTIERRIKEKVKKVHPSLRVFFFIEEKENAFIIRLRRAMAEIKVIDTIANQIIEDINNAFAKSSKYEVRYVKNDSHRVKKTGR